MKIARQEQDYQINIGEGMARGLFNITDQANNNSLKATSKMRVSDWFDVRTKDWLQSLPTEEFIEGCEKLL